MTFVLLNPVSNSWLLSDLTCHVVWRSWLLLAGVALSPSSPCPPGSLLSHRPPLHGLLSCLLTSLTFSCWYVPRHGLGSFYFPSINTYSLVKPSWSHGFWLQLCAYLHIYICISTPTSLLNCLLSIRKSDRQPKLSPHRQEPIHWPGYPAALPLQEAAILPEAEANKYQVCSFSHHLSPMHQQSFLHLPWKQWGIWPFLWPFPIIVNTLVQATTTAHQAYDHGSQLIFQFLLLPSESPLST